MEPEIRFWRVVTRLSMGMLILWAFASVLHTVLAVGHYEDRIVAYTHGNPDVTPAWLAYGLLEELTPPGRADIVAGQLWMFASMTAALIFAVWLSITRLTGAQLGKWRASVLVTVALQGLLLLYSVMTARGGAMRGTWLDTRLVAYPLWAAATFTVLVTAFLSVRVIRLVTRARQQPA